MSSRCCTISQRVFDILQRSARAECYSKVSISAERVRRSYENYLIKDFWSNLSLALIYSYPLTGNRTKRENYFWMSPASERMCERFFSVLCLNLLCTLIDSKVHRHTKCERKKLSRPQASSCVHYSSERHLSSLSSAVYYIVSGQSSSKALLLNVEQMLVQIRARNVLTVASSVCVRKIDRKGMRRLISYVWQHNRMQALQTSGL